MSTELDLTAEAAARALTQVTALIRWVGAGRKLTQAGRLTMVDARELVGLLGTGDEIDPAIGAGTRPACAMRRNKAASEVSQ